MWQVWVPEVLFTRSDLKLAHLSVCSAGQLLNKAQSIIRYFAWKKNDLICLTESKVSKQNKNFFQHKDYHTFQNTPWDPQSHTLKEGLAILVNKPFDPLKIEVEDISPGKASKVEWKVNEPSKSHTHTQTYVVAIFAREVLHIFCVKRQFVHVRLRCVVALLCVGCIITFLAHSRRYKKSSKFK